MTDHSDTNGSLYDPMDEYEDDDGDGPRFTSGWGSGRRKTLDAIEAKDRLDETNFHSLTELKNALLEISLSYRDGETYMRPPTSTVDTVEQVFHDLPTEAQKPFLNDDTLYRRVNAARNQFNDFLGKLKRIEEMPSPAEAGPANYPADKARRRAKSRRKASDELEERLKKVEQAARGGARQRALESIGSSVAEQNEQEREEQRDSMKERLSPGDIVLYRSPNLHAGAVVRVNKKSVRVSRRNPLKDNDQSYTSDDEFRRETIQLDSDHLYKVPEEDLEDASEMASEKGGLDRGQEIPDNLFDAQIQMLGEEWISKHPEHAANELLAEDDT